MTLLHEMARLWAATGESNNVAYENVAEESDESRLHLCLSVFWLREYAWAHAEAYHGNPREEVAEQIDTAVGETPSADELIRQDIEARTISIQIGH